MEQLLQKTMSTVQEMIAQHDAKVVDLRFTDLLGQWQHFSMPIAELTEDLFTKGAGFDGSSITGFQQIHESDMILIPDPKTAFMDPCFDVPTLVLICSIKDPIAGMPYTRDSRYIAMKAEEHLVKTGLATTSYWGPEAEFYIFDSVRFKQNQHEGYYHIDSEEGIWNSGKEGTNLAHRPMHQGGYFPLPPVDKTQDLRSQIMLALQSAGLDVEVHHHEVGTAGQAEIDLRYNSLLKMGDQLMAYKYIVKNVCAKHNYTATFMPKPLFSDNGSGMHVHQSLWDMKKNLFATGRTGELSQMAKYYIGGLIKHAHAILAFAAPTTNSYRRLVPGFEAPVNLVYSRRNRSAICRIPTYSGSPSAQRVEFRAADATANPYLTFAAMLMAGLDGIKNKIEPPEEMNKNLYAFTDEEIVEMQVGKTPANLRQALDALEQDHAFLLEGGVFTEDVIQTWLELKWEEVEYVSQRPHPAEFELYYSS